MRTIILTPLALALVALLAGESQARPRASGRTPKRSLSNRILPAASVRGKPASKGVVRSKKKDKKDTTTTGGGFIDPFADDPNPGTIGGGSSGGGSGGRFIDPFGPGGSIAGPPGNSSGGRFIDPFAPGNGSSGSGSSKPSGSGGRSPRK